MTLRPSQSDDYCQRPFVRRTLIRDRPIGDSMAELSAEKTESLFPDADQTGCDSAYRFYFF